ncbi:hypothetical protein RCOM_0254640 [Ricinus communis]|uniref:Calmodulin-binding domain-containing protein n=1 Tax=Ricinus communis TaxID=3988 RepID=B9SVR3_RICCO|nr:hypothetical protein RCOM_0254640 [Ricinus communis]|eukprot:XP_002530082.1 calmodulin binding protein PICBP [Ricinus communis]
MTPSKLESEPDSDHSILSGSLSVTTDSPATSYQNQDIKNKGATESRKKVTKLRSIKLVKLPSLRFSTRQSKIQSSYLCALSSDAASSVQPPQIDASSPNYMKTTTSSDAKKESLQKSVRALSRRSSFKPSKSLTRVSSTKFRRSLMRKSSGGSDVKKKLKKSRSIKLGRRSSVVLPDDSDASPNHLKSTECSDVENTCFQASFHNSESCLSSNDESKRSSSNLNMNIASGKKSIRVVTRTSVLRPPKVLTKMASLRTKRLKKSSQLLDSTVHKATCSSALKDSKITDHLELQPGGSETEGISATKVCPYSYCSLHGHQRSTVPPLRRFVSMRRRMLKTQKSIKLDNQVFRGAKCSNNTKKGIRRSKTIGRRDASVLETANKSGAVTSIRKMAEPKADVNEESSSNGGDGEDTVRSGSSAEIMIGEPSHSHLHLKENLQMSKFPTAEKNDVPTCLLQRETSKECSHKCTLDHPEHVDFSLEKTESPKQCDMLPFDESACSCHEEVPEDGIVHKEVNGDRVSSLNLDVFKGYLKLNISQENTSAGVDKELFNVSRNLTQKIIVESKEINGMGSSPSAGELLEAQTAAGEESNEDSSADSESDQIADVVDRTGIGKQKSIGLWNLIYQHMVSGIAEGDEMQPPVNKMNKEEQEDDAMKKPGPFSDFSGVDQNISKMEHDGGSPHIQLYQRNAIKLVQEAFDKILAEIPDHASDDQSMNGGTTSDKELAEKNHDEGKELSTVQAQKEINSEADKINGPEGEKAESKVERKANQQKPNSWSNLKKIIILRKFVKELEKVRNINPRKPQYLPGQPEPEGEKIHLRHLAMGGRKNSEEWMLDYALQQVISTLAPAQKRKVALLVQAFETVGPLPEISPTSNVAASSHATPVQTSTASSYQRSFETGEETSFEISLYKTLHCEICSQNQDQVVCDSWTAEKHIPESLLELKEPSSESGSIHTTRGNLASDTTADQRYSNSADVASTSLDEFLVKEEVIKEVCLISASEVHDSDSGQELASNYQINASGENSDQLKSHIPKTLEGSIASNNVMITSVPVTEMVEESYKAKEVKTMLQNKFLQALTPHEEFKSSSADVAYEKQKNVRLWSLIYKHMISGNATVLDEATDKEEQSDDANTSYGKHNVFSHQRHPVRSKHIEMENHGTDNQKVDLLQMEAIRMVEEAIDEISLPDSQDDSPDDQSVTKDSIPFQEHLERQPDVRGEYSISTSILPTKKSNGESKKSKMEQMTLDSRKPCQNSEKNKTEFEENKPKLSTQKSWGNLKKLILLNRFVKAMEKVKKFNPREPRFLPFDPEKEPEKVQLRHQEMEDRKNADEWMLDYALQQVVAKLTPARKRKVELLIEAFETVIPTIGS